MYSQYYVHDKINIARRTIRIECFRTLCLNSDPGGVSGSYGTLDALR